MPAPRPDSRSYQQGGRRDRFTRRNIRPDGGREPADRDDDGEETPPSATGPDR
jgi:hypothetical protein